MRHQRSIRLLVTGSFLLGLVGCTTDVTKPSSETPPTSTVAQAQGEAMADGPHKASSEAESVQERGVLRTPLQMPPSAVAGPPLPAWVGPTANITAVANAIAMTHKSLTTLVTAKPGLTLTQPVTISIGFNGGANPPQRVTQSYVASTGNHFLYNDGEGDGKPRRLNVDITIEEPKPVGGIYSYTLPFKAELDPLYDVTISPAQFKLYTNCDLVGDSEVKFSWVPPDHKGQAFSFSTSAGKPINIGAFAWTRAEISASAKLHDVGYWFKERDPEPIFKYDNPIVLGSLPPLLPGKTHQVFQSISEVNGQHCSASVQYTITYHLRWYPFL